MEVDDAVNEKKQKKKKDKSGDGDTGREGRATSPERVVPGYFVDHCYEIEFDFSQDWNLSLLFFVVSSLSLLEGLVPC